MSPSFEVVGRNGGEEEGKEKEKEKEKEREGLTRFDAHYWVEGGDTRDRFDLSSLDHA